LRRRPETLLRRIAAKQRSRCLKDSCCRLLLGEALAMGCPTKMHAKVTLHGHHHDCIESSSRWQAQAFKGHWVGLRDITVIDDKGVATVVSPDEQNNNRAPRQRMFDAFGGDK
jgi:hypothetical protein